MKSFRKKLTIAALAVVSFVRVAHAAQLIVFEQPLDTSNHEISADFAVNRELGRAWIDVQIRSTDYIGEGLPLPDLIMRLVDGLYYDSVRKQVLYRNSTETTVCAEDATFLWKTYLKSTGNCRLSPSSEQRKVDDGFNVREETVAKIVFDAPASTTLQPAAASEGMIH